MENMRKVNKIIFHNKNIDIQKLPNPIRETWVSKLGSITIPYLNSGSDLCFPQTCLLHKLVITYVYYICKKKTQLFFPPIAQSGFSVYEISFKEINLSGLPTQNKTWNSTNIN